MAAQDLISKKQLRLIVEALEYKAHNEAGLSQTPYLFSKEDTEEWLLAKALREIYSIYESPNTSRTRVSNLT